MTATLVKAGLDGVVAAETRLSGVDGEAGELIIAGFAVEELAPQATFEEVVYLLWHDALPTAGPTFEVPTVSGERKSVATDYAGRPGSGGSPEGIPDGCVAYGSRHS